MTVATQPESTRHEAEKFLRRVQVEYPHLIGLGYQAIINVTVKGMAELGIDGGSLNESKFMAGLQHAMTTGAVPKTAQTAQTAQPAPQVQLAQPPVVKSAAEQEYDAVAEQYDPAQLSQFSRWFNNQGQVEKSGDAGFENAAGLLTELRGHQITNEAVQNAMLRIGAPASRYHSRRRQLHFVPTPTQTTPRGRHGHIEGQKPGEFISGANKTPAQYKAEMNAAAEANNPTSASSKLASQDRHAAESLQGNNHGETDQIRKVFVTKGTDIDWSGTLAARKRFQALLNNRRQVR
jgi:hypothetical protein